MATKYYHLKILSRINYTSPEILLLRERKPTSDEYSSLIQNIKIQSNNSQKILDFFANYKDGFILPDRCDAYEPIREKFNPKNLVAPIRWLSQPGGGVYLKKIKPFKYEGVLENHCLALVWDEKGIPLSINKGPFSERDPYYLSEISLHVAYKIIDTKSENILINLFNDLYDVSCGEYGFIKDEDKNIMLEKGAMLQS